MGIFDSLLGKAFRAVEQRGAIDYGKTKKDGGHDHRNNTGPDRTPAQKDGDRKRQKG